MPKRKGNGILVFALLIAACSSTGSQTSTAGRDVPTPNATATRFEVKMYTPTWAPERTNTPEATSTPQVNILLTDACVQMTSSPTGAPPGTVVLESHFGNSGLLLLDPETNQSVSVGQMRSWGASIGVSLDHQRMAFISVDNQRLIIVNADGDVLRSIPVPESWQSIIQWVDDDSILIENMRFTKNTQSFTYSSSILFDLVTSEQQEYLSDFPDRTIPFDAAWGSHFGTGAVYDPAFTRVAYTGQIGTAGFLILRDLQREQTIGKWDSDELDYQGVPLWTRDGTHFIAGIYPTLEKWNGEFITIIDDNLPYVGGYDLFNISRNGEVERLTYLTTEYKAGFEGRSLSPDERYLAFWLNLDYTPSDHRAVRSLAVLDLETGEITNLCLAGGDVPVAPVWSPDGKYLIVTVTNMHFLNTRDKDFSLDVILVDLENREAIKIAENARGIGWIISDNP